jgi:hypothetical protein
MKEAMRLTIIDAQTTISLVAHASASLALTAACAANPQTVDDILTGVMRYDRKLPYMVRHGLAVFDEHNTAEDHRAIETMIATQPHSDLPVFRVMGETTRDVSLEPVKEGVVLYNLPRQRIVQIINTYEPLQRAGEVNYHNGQFLSIRRLPYELPLPWSIVP